MASRVNLSFKDPRTGLSFFYNVSEHVGPRPTIGVARTPSHEKVMKNSPDDVMLVQFFLRQICDASVERLPEPTGSFDVYTGFLIYYQQDLFGYDPDGIVTPARGLNYNEYSNYFIVRLNETFLEMKGKAAFEAIPSRPELRPTLRASLKSSAP